MQEAITAIQTIKAANETDHAQRDAAHTRFLVLLRYPDISVPTILLPIIQSIFILVQFLPKNFDIHPENLTFY